MKMVKHETIYGMLFSIVFHGIIIASLWSYLRTQMTPLIKGQLESHTISAALYTADPAQAIAPPIPLQRKVSPIKASPQKKILKKQAPQKKMSKKVSVNATRSHLNQSQAILGTKVNELITLLHQAIQAHQHYPPSAEAMGQSGHTIVAFTLYLDGHVNDVRMIQSSGFNSLDHAALAAIYDAAPFQNVEHYLQQPQQFSIAVVFESS